jgi:hypothetical protein
VLLAEVLPELFAPASVEMAKQDADECADDTD